MAKDKGKKDSSPKPSETLGGHGGGIKMSAVLELMDRFAAQTDGIRDDIRRVEDAVRRVEDADRGRARELHEKIDSLGKDLHAKTETLTKEFREKIEEVQKEDRRRDEERRNMVEERAQKIDTRLDDIANELVTGIGNLRTEMSTQIATLQAEVSGLKAKHEGEFADAPWYLRPAYVRALGMAIAALIAAIAGAWYVASGQAPPEKEEKPKAPVTAPENPPPVPEENPN